MSRRVVLGRVYAGFWALASLVLALVLTLWNAILAFRAGTVSPERLLGVAIGALTLAALVLCVACLFGRVRSMRFRRGAWMIAFVSAACVAVYGLVRELQTPAPVSLLVRSARYASPVLGGLVLATFMDPVLRAHARRTCRRRHARRRGFVPLVLGVTIAAAVTSALALRPERDDGGTLLRAGPRPTKRLWIVGVDGVDQRGLARWVAFHSTSTMARLALSGASAYFSWDAEGGRGWESLLCGEPWPEGASVDPLSDNTPGWRDGVRDAFLLPQAAIRRGSDARRPNLWRVAEAAGLETATLGFPEDLEGETGLVLPDSTYAWARDILSGSRAAPLGVPQAGRALDWARPPWDAWRSGARLSAEEESLRTASDALGVEVDGAWRDRFFRQAMLDVISRKQHEVIAVNFNYPFRLEAGKDVSDLQGPAAVRTAVGYYLEAFDRFVASLMTSLRAGDTLVLLFAPAPSPFGAGQGATGTGLALLFGEKIRAQSAEGETVTTADLTQTLVFLLGLKRSRELRGDIVWGLLVEGAERSFVPETVSRYPSL